MKISIQSLQFRRLNKSGNKTLRQVWDVVSRDDSPARMLIETWGGKPDGYIKSFATDIILGNYLSKRIAKTAAGAADDEIELDLVGDETYVINGYADRIDNAMKAENHENAKMRMKISGASSTWDDDTCLNKVISGIADFDHEFLSVDNLTQAMASRVKSTFKPSGSYNEQLLSIYEFMQSSGGSLDDVLGEGEEVDYPPMDRERLAEVIQLADGLRERLSVTREEVMEPSPAQILMMEPDVLRGEEWGGWA